MGFIVPINSSVFNTLEFLLYDLVIAAFVHVLTSRLVGLYNYLHIQRNPRYVHICDEFRMPLFDQGIVSTKREVFYIAVFVRMFSWALILGASLLVRGVSYPVVTEEPALVRTLGSFSVFDPPSQRLRNKMRGQGCVRRLSDRVYLGEIRNNSCELSQELLSKPIIEMALDFQPTSVTTQGCESLNSSINEFSCNRTANSQKHNQSKIQIYCTFNGSNPSRDSRNNETCYINGIAPQTQCTRTSNDFDALVPFTCGNNTEQFSIQCESAGGYDITYALCDNAVVACVNTRLAGLQCSGLVSIRGTTHLCEEVDNNNMNNRIASCKWVRGGEWNITDWVSFFGGVAVNTIDNVYAVALNSGLENRIVRTHATGESKQGTEVPWAWVVIMVTKVLIVIVLAIVCEVLRRKHNLLSVANDESGIYRLIRTTVRTMDRRSEDTQDRNDRLRVELVNGDARLFEDTDNIAQRQ